MKKFILPVLGLGAWLTAALIGPIAAQITKDAREVYFLVPHADPAVVEFAEFSFEAKPGDPDYDKKVLGIYGVPFADKELVIVDPSRLKHPKLKPELAYVPVGSDKDERPWQVKTIRLVAAKLRGGAVITGSLFLILFLLMQAAAPALGARSAAAD